MEELERETKQRKGKAKEGIKAKGQRERGGLVEEPPIEKLAQAHPIQARPRPSTPPPLLLLSSRPPRPPSASSVLLGRPRSAFTGKKKA